MTTTLWIAVGVLAVLVLWLMLAVLLGAVHGQEQRREDDR